ncbi:MAG: hypothetical protein GY788_23560, partial [bacterium]|nr:hypothetical protein [bacterium]
MGLCVTAGTITYDNTFDEANKRWQRVYRLYDYPVDGLSQVAIGGEWVELDAVEDGDRGFKVITGEAANYVWIKFYDGRQVAADPGLISNAKPSGRWESTAVGTGICYAVVTALYDLDAHNTPPQMLFEVRGSRLYDWRKDDTAGGSGTHRIADPTTWEFTENPVVIEYNYRLGLTYGGDFFIGMEMDQSDLPLDKWTTAANICDEMVEAEARFRLSLIVEADARHSSTINAIARSTGGMVVNGVDGTWPIIGTDQPVVATLTDDDVVDGTRAAFKGLRSMSDLVNSISGTYPDPDNVWSPTP